MLFQYANVGNVWTYPQLSPAIPSYPGLVYGHFCRFIQLGAFRGGRCSGPPHVPKGGTMVADVAMDMFEKKRGSKIGNIVRTPGFSSSNG